MVLDVGVNLGQITGNASDLKDAGATAANAMKEAVKDASDALKEAAHAGTTAVKYAGSFYAENSV
jgi:hypothetical protein